MLSVSILLVRIGWVLTDILINDSFLKMFHNPLKNILETLMGVSCFVSLPWSLFLSISTHTHAHSVHVSLCPIATSTITLQLVSLPSTCPSVPTLLEQCFRKWLLWLLYSKPSTHSKFTVLNQSLKFLTPSGLWPLLLTFLLFALRLASLPILPPTKNSLPSGTCFTCGFPSLLWSPSDVYMTCSVFTSRSLLICVLIQGSFLDQPNKNNP